MLYKSERVELSFRPKFRFSSYQASFARCASLESLFGNKSSPMLIVVKGALANFWRMHSEISNVAKALAEKRIELSEDQTHSLNRVQEKIGRYRSSYAAACKQKHKASPGGAVTDSINKLKEVQSGMLKYAETIFETLLAGIPQGIKIASTVGCQLVIILTYL